MNHNWQPIETAPKDGTEVIVCLRKERWQKKSEVTVASYRKMLAWGWYRGSETFMDVIAWMPYPGPPAAVPGAASADTEK